MDVIGARVLAMLTEELGMKFWFGLSGLFSLLWLVLLGLGLWWLIGWLQWPPMTVTPSLDAVIGFFTLLWLYFVVTVPWNIVFQAKQLLYEVQVSQQRGIRTDPEAVAYARRWARLALWVALGLHVLTAAVLSVAAYSGVGLIGWLGAGAAILLTLLRPGLRAYTHVRDRLSRLTREVEIPREDAVELRRRLQELEQQLVSLTQRHADTTQHTEGRLHRLETELTEASDKHDTLAEHVRLELVRVERDAQNTVAQVLGDAAVVGHVRELVRFFKTA